MAHDIIEIDSDSDVPTSNARAKTVNKGNVNVGSAADGSDIVWDTLDDGWVDRIMKEGRER